MRPLPPTNRSPLGAKAIWRACDTPVAQRIRQKWLSAVHAVCSADAGTLSHVFAIGTPPVPPVPPVPPAAEPPRPPEAAPAVPPVPPVPPAPPRAVPPVPPRAVPPAPAVAVPPAPAVA